MHIFINTFGNGLFADKPTRDQSSCRSAFHD